MGWLPYSLGLYSPRRAKTRCDTFSICFGRRVDARGKLLVSATIRSPTHIGRGGTYGFYATWFCTGWHMKWHRNFHSSCCFLFRLSRGNARKFDGDESISLTAFTVLVASVRDLTIARAFRYPTPTCLLKRLLLALLSLARLPCLSRGCHAFRRRQINVIPSTCCFGGLSRSSYDSAHSPTIPLQCVPRSTHRCSCSLPCLSQGCLKFSCALAETSISRP